MAKTGFWLRGSNGKLAGATIYQSQGETVIREIVTPNNPKTEKQIIQRIIMHTVMQAYSKMKEICDHSFEGFKKGQPTMSYFMSQNVGFAREKVAQMQASGVSFENMYNFVPLRMKGFTPNQYQVSMGSLPRVDCTLYDDDEAKGFVPVIRENTYAAVANALGAQRGDQVTFLMIDANSAASFGACNFHFARVILDPTAADFSQAPMSSAFLDGNGKINLPSVRNEGNFTFSIDAEKGLSFTYNGSLTCVACAVILSRKMNDKWLRSTAYLTYNGVEEYSLGQCIYAAESGTNSEIYAAADAYLNNAGQGGGIAASESNSSTGGSGDSGVTPTPVSGAALSGATIDSQAMINGSIKTVTLAAGTEFPVTKEVVATGNAECNGKKLVIKQGDTEVANAVFADGTATVSHAWAKNEVYQLWIKDEEAATSTNTGYKFAITSSGGNGEGGDAE